MVLFSLIVFLTLKLVRDVAAVHPAGWAQAQQASYPQRLYMTNWPTPALYIVCHLNPELPANSTLIEAKLDDQADFKQDLYNSKLGYFPQLRD